MKRKGYMILLVCMLLILSACTRRVPVTTETTELTTTEAEVEAVSFTGTIKGIDLLLNEIVFVDVQTKEQRTLEYHGGVDLTDKYGEIMAVSQLPVGEVVDGVYQPEKAKLVSIHVNETAMRYEGVKNADINLFDKTVRAAGETMSYDDQVVIYDGEKLCKMAELTSQDQLTLRVYNGKLCSAVVELGHGYLRFENYDTYLDGMIEVGYDVIVPVTEDMLLTVREGEYLMRITKGSHTGTRYVTVERNVETTVDLGALQIEPEKTGAAVISVLPDDCSPVIYVDGTKCTAGEEVELVYGRHSIVIRAEGYEPYAGYFELEQAYKRYEYTLTKEGETATAIEDGDTGSTEGTTATTEETTTAENASTVTDTSEGNTAGTNKITITAPVGAKLYVDGKYVGDTPCSFTKVAGSHIITLTREGCVTVTYTITAVDNGKDDSYSYDELELFSDSLDAFLN